MEMPPHLITMVKEHNDSLITLHEQMTRCEEESDKALWARDYDGARRWKRRGDKVFERILRQKAHGERLERLAEQYHEENCPNCRAHREAWNVGVNASRKAEALLN